MRSSRYHLSIRVVLPNIDTSVERKISNMFSKRISYGLSIKLIKAFVLPQLDGPQMMQRIVFGSKGPCLRISLTVSSDASCDRDSTLLSIVIVVRIAFTYLCNAHGRCNASEFFALFISSSRRSIRTVYCKERGCYLKNVFLANR